MSDFDQLLQVLIRALRRLGETGHPDDASRLAASGWSAIRRSNPQAAERLNGTMHYLARLPDPVNTPHHLLVPDPLEAEHKPAEPDRAR